jgi:hypothetical protein
VNQKELHDALTAHLRNESYGIFLTSSGPSGGTDSIVGNHSSAAFFWAAPPPTEKWKVNRAMIYIEDAGKPVASTLGAMTALTGDNGVKFEKRSSTDVVLNNPAGPNYIIQKNSDLERICYDVTYTDFTTGNDIVACRWTFTSDGGGAGQIVNGAAGEKFGVSVKGNITDLVHFSIRIGYSKLG